MTDTPRPGDVIGYGNRGPIRLVGGAAPETEERNGLLPGSMEDLKGRTPDELRKMRDVLDAHMRSLYQTDTGEIRDMSDDERAAFVVGEKLLEELDSRLSEHERVAKIFARRPAAVEQVYRNLRNGIDENSTDVRRLTDGEARDRALRVLDGDRTATMHLRDDQREQVERSLRRDTGIARRIIVTENEHYRTAFQKLVTDPQAAAQLTDDERASVRAWQEYRALAEGAGSSGGFGIPVFIDPSIILTAQGSGNPFMSIARQVPVNTNAWKGVSSAGVTWAFQAEAAATTDNAPSLAQPTVTVFMARGFVPYSIEVEQDYPGFADEMSRLLGEGYDELLIDKFSRGSGSGEPQGIITALDADTTAEVRLTTAGAFVEQDLYNTWKALPQRFRGVSVGQAGGGAASPRAVASWMMSVGVNNAIRRFGTANVFHALTETLSGEWVEKLFNRQVYESPYFPDVVNTTGPFNQLVVGDFSNYIVARRGGMSVELVPTLFDVTNNRPTGQRGWFAYARIGGGVATTAAFKMLNQT